MKSLLLISTTFLVAMFCTAAAEDRALLKEYRGEVVLPAELYQTYASLVTALETGNAEAIRTFCLPGKIKVTEAARPRDQREYGSDINLPYLKDGFPKLIRTLRKDRETASLIRTDSTALWFTKAADGKWKLSQYLDKPIE